MLLTLDIGNTMLTFGVFNNAKGDKEEFEPLHTWKVATDTIYILGGYRFSNLV